MPRGILATLTSHEGSRCFCSAGVALGPPGRSAEQVHAGLKPLGQRIDMEYYVEKSKVGLFWDPAIMRWMPVWAWVENSGLSHKVLGAGRSCFRGLVSAMLPVTNPGEPCRAADTTGQQIVLVHLRSVGASKRWVPVGAGGCCGAGECEGVVK